jgi:hypothetical protein
MAQQIVQTQPVGPTTEEAFVADRQIIWSSFTRFIMLGIAAVVAILILMAIFLL